ncbi:hypothetical protein LUW75_01785 [Streptomyces sp. MRC013]|uniref:SAV_2336 N-terminal domain-related protein n=1 Tax=Streptomyces sp. MRC013 TaxID=2898276 RepID=UPI0020260E6A|nr:SAV_2336 N-terminal domain-related protein [Streptomyces sp. MRC013]URM88959.1 hypothetical protein LUW75_01785 [Streptomyces sp. MRC013]
MPDALGRVLSALRAAVPHLDPAEDGGAGPGGLDGTALAEALWLAAAMARDRPAPPAPAPPPSAAPGGDAPAPRGADPERPPRRPPERPHAPASSDAAAPPADARGLHERLPGAGTRLRGHAVAAPRATGLPRALEVTRALRPWKRPWPEGRRAALDIEATVEGYARSGELLPVFSAAPERWFDLTLVVDRSPNMRVWEETLDDFTAVLDRLGAFRTLRVRDLLFDGAGRPQAPGQLRQADGRRLVVVVSDCVSAPWRTSPVWRLLREWAATTPTALLNPLPAKLWRRGGLDLPTVRFTPAAPGAHRSRLPHAAPSLLGLPEPAGAPRGGTPAGGDADRREAGAWLPVPVLSLSPHSLDRWSRAAMRGAPEGCTAVLVPPGGRPPGRPRRRAVPLPPGTAAEGFLRTAAPRAVRLAVLCAPFDRLSLRLLHVIRRELVPDATTADVAEAVTSGLFELEQPSGGSGPLELLLPEEVRAVLRRRLPAHEAWRVHQALDRHVASLGDGRPGLRSVAYDASAPRELPAEQEAFARASRQTLELLGLAVPGERVPASGGDGEGRGPGASGVFPPPPERFVRREHAADSLLARLVDPAAGTVWVTAAGDGPGAGRTALALHVAHRFPGERHFVDMRGSGDHPVPPEAALHRLLSSLGASGGEEARGTEELAAALAEAVGGRRVLLVLDDVPEPARMERLLPSAPGCAVLATTRGDVPQGYRLASLSDHGAVELLAAWAGLREHGEHAALRELTAGRVRQPLTLRIVGSWIASGSAPSLPELSRLAHEVGPGAVRPFPEEDPAAVLLHLRLRALPDREREALRRFAFVPTGELTRTEAWALLGDDRAARAVLGRLAAAGLLDRRGAGVYRMPEEVRREVGREGGYEVAAEPYLRRLVSHHLTRAAALYEEDHPGSALAENLRVRAAGAADDPASRHVWLDNALVLAATAGVLPPERLADLLLLLHARGASAAHRSRFERAARAVIRVASGRSEGAVLRRSVAALALARYAAGAVADAAAALEGVAEEEWERDGALRGPVKRLAGQLAAARGAPAEAEGFLRRALDAFRADGDRFGTAAACLDLASVLVRLGRADEVLPIVREALGCYADSVPHPLMRGALLALEDALAEAGRHRELLAVRRALLAQCETEGGDACAEARLLIRIARTLIALGEHAEARGSR